MVEGRSLRGDSDNAVRVSVVTRIWVTITKCRPHKGLHRRPAIGHLLSQIFSRHVLP